MSNWRGIETAPKDGTVFDVWLGDADADEVEFYCGPLSRRSTDWHWHRDRFRPVMGLALPVVTVMPTHWMHRPEPPV